MSNNVFFEEICDGVSAKQQEVLKTRYFSGIKLRQLIHLCAWLSTRGLLILYTESVNIANTRLQLVFSSFPSWSQMSFRVLSQFILSLT